MTNCYSLWSSQSSSPANKSSGVYMDDPVSWTCRSGLKRPRLNTPVLTSKRIRSVVKGLNENCCRYLNLQVAI